MNILIKEFQVLKNIYFCVFGLKALLNYFPDYNLVLDIDNDENQKYSEFINNQDLYTIKLQWFV